MPVKNVPVQEVVDRGYVVRSAQNGKSKTVLSLHHRQIPRLGVLLRFCARGPFIYVDGDKSSSPALVALLKRSQRADAIVRFGRPEVKHRRLTAKRGERPLRCCQIWK